MELTLLAACITLGLLLIASAFFSSSETALFSLQTIEVRRIQHSHPAAGRRIALMLASPADLLSTILIGNTIVNVFAAVLGFFIAERLLPGRGEAVSIVAMTLLLLIFGEIAPKRMAMRWPVKISPYYVPPLRVLILVLAPARKLLRFISDSFAEHFSPRSRHLTEDEFLSVVSISEEEGVLDKEERAMVDGIIRLEDTQASEVMTPRVDLVGIEVNDDPEKIAVTTRETKFHYLPIYRESLDNIVGFLDVLRYTLSPNHDVAAATVPVFHVPETAPLDALLATFQREGHRVATVVDEFGGTAGLITMGDVLEEIVDDVENEYGDDGLTMEQIGPDTWLIDGSTSLEDINYELELQLEAEGADRIAGWVSAEAGRLPKPGEVVEAQQCRAIVRRVRKTRITLVQLQKLPPDDDEGDEDE